MAKSISNDSLVESVDIFTDSKAVYINTYIYIVNYSDNIYIYIYMIV